MATIFPPNYRSLTSKTSFTWDRANRHVWMGRYRHGSVVYNGFTNPTIITMGGEDGILNKSGEKYDMTTGTYGTMPNMGTSRSLFPLVELASGDILAVGGGFRSNIDATSFRSYTNTAEKFNGTGWAPVAGFNPTLSNTSAGHTATLLNTNEVLIAGGFNDISGYLAASDLYNEASDSFAATGSLTHSRYRHSAILLNDGTVAVIGGVSGDGAVSTYIEIYDPGTGTWSVSGASIGVCGLSAVVKLNDGTVLVTGGIDEGVLSTCYIFDPTGGGSVTPVSPMNKGRFGHSISVIDSGPNAGNVIVIGGYTDSEVPAPGQWYPATTIGEMYDVNTDTWTVITDVGYSVSESSSHSSGSKVINVGGVALFNTNMNNHISSNATLITETNVTVPDLPSTTLGLRMPYRDYACIISNGQFNPTSVYVGVSIPLTVGNTEFTVSLAGTETDAYLLADAINNQAVLAGVDNLYVEAVNDTSLRLVSSDRIYTGPNRLTREAFDFVGLPVNYLSDPTQTGVTEISVPYFNIPSAELLDDNTSNILTIPDEANRVILYVDVKVLDWLSVNTAYVGVLVTWDDGSLTDEILYGYYKEPSIINHFSNNLFTSPTFGDSLLNVNGNVSGLPGMLIVKPSPSNTTFSGYTRTVFTLEPPPGATGIKVTPFTYDFGSIIIGNTPTTSAYMAPRVSISMVTGTR